MAKKIGDLLKDLLGKAGVDLTKEELKKVLEIGEEIPDDIADTVNKALLTVTAAQSHPEVTKKMKAEIFNGVDKRIDDLLTEMELEADDDFKAEKNSFEKISRLTKMAKAAGEKKKGAGTRMEKDEFAEKEKQYNAEIKKLKDDLVAQKTTFDTERENDAISFELKQELGGKNYIFPKEMDASVKINTAMSTVQAELQKKGFSIKRGENGQLVILNKEGRPAYSDTNVALEPKTFIDGVLAQNKLLAVNKETPPGGGGANPGGTVIPGEADKGNLNVVTAIAQELQALETQ